MSNKFDEFLNAMKLGELMHRKDPAEERRHTFMCVLAIIGAVAAVAAIAYAVYRYMNPDYLEDFDDDFDDYDDDAEGTDSQDGSSDSSETEQRTKRQVKSLVMNKTKWLSHCGSHLFTIYILAFRFILLR